MVPIDNYHVTIKYWGRALAMPVQGVHLSDVGFPNGFTLEIKTLKSVGAEVGKQVLAIGDCQLGCQACSVMSSRTVRSQRICPSDRLTAITINLYLCVLGISPCPPGTPLVRGANVLP